jgi:hypothetical protein
MEKEIIYGVVDKNGTCDSYVGFFKNEEDSIKELNNQMTVLKYECGIKNLSVVGDKVVETINGKDFVKFAVHRYVLR